MSVHGISAIPIGAQPASAVSFSVTGDAGFGDKLQLGQILKARVLRHYEGSRYTVDFDGHEKIVDSAVPLQTGEVLHGKVVGLGEQVVLERVRAPVRSAGGDSAVAPERKFWSRTDSAAKLVADLFEQYQGRLTPEQTLLMEQSVRRAENPQLMAMSGLLLSKLGVGLPSEWLKSIYELLRTEPHRGLFALAGKLPELQTVNAMSEAARGVANESPIAALAELLKQCMEPSPEDSRPDESPTTLSGAAQEQQPHAGAMQQKNGQADGGYDPARRLLNVQSGSSVAHRINTIPLLVNDRLVELNIAVFEQREGHQTKEATRHRQLCFSLHSEQLGHVEVRTLLTGEHMKMRFSSDREETAEWLAAYSPELMLQLKDEGWQMDELNYEVKPPESAGVARVVLQHLITQDSVSRLM